MITVAIPGPPGREPPSIIARFSRKGLAKDAHILGEGSFRVDGEGDDRVAQGRAAAGTRTRGTSPCSPSSPASGVSRIFRVVSIRFRRARRRTSPTS